MFGKTNNHFICLSFNKKKENILDLKYFQKWNDVRKSKALYYYVGYYYMGAWCNIVVTCDVCIIHWGRKWNLKKK